MLDFQLKQVAFRYGIAEGDDPHAVPFGVLTTLENYVWKKSNRIEKRQGTLFLGATTPSGTLTSAKRLFTRNSDKELCVFDGTSLYSYVQAVNWAWSPVAAVPDVGLTQQQLLDPLSGIQSSDSAVAGNYVVTAIVPGDPTGATPSIAGVSVCITDVNTGALLLPLTVVTASAVAQGVRVIALGPSLAVIVAAGSADATIRAWTVDLVSFVVSAATNLRTDRANGQHQNWDARRIGGTSLFVLAYDTTAAGVRATSYNSAFVVQQSALTVGFASPSRLAVDATSGESMCIVGFTNTSNMMAGIFNPVTMVLTAGLTNIDNSGAPGNGLGVCRYDATTYAIVYGTLLAGSTVSSVFSRMFTSAAALVANAKRITAGAQVASNPFMVNGKCYVFANIAAGYGSGGSGSIAAPFTGNASVMLGVFPGLDDGSGAATNLTHPLLGCVDTLLGANCSDRSCRPVFTAVSTTRVIGSIPFVGTAPNSYRTWRCAVRLMTVTAGTDVPLDLWRTVSRGSETYIAGPALSVYDGGDVFDYGFVYAPAFVTLSTSGAGGVIAAGNYTYASYPEYRGASGIVYRGPTVVSPILPTSGATSSNTLKFANVNVGNKKHLQTERFSTSLPIFRTVVNGTIPQRLTEEPTFNLSPLAYQSPTQNFVDTVADAAIDTNNTALASRPALYTQGGVLDDQATPACITMFTHVDRLFVLLSDQRTWGYSKSFNDDIGTAPGFHFSFRIAMPTQQVGGVSMDDKAIFFGLSGVHYMLGNGPAKDGTNSDFGPPIKIQTDVGCINARSIVSVPDGTMFQSLRGIYILTRGLDIEWIGRAVKDTLALYPNITSAVLVPNRNEVRFTANNSNATLGVVLVFNYVEKQWSTSKYLAGGVYGCPFADACMWNGLWTFATPAGLVFQESDTNCLDNNTTYAPGIIETAWNSATGPIAYQAVRNFWVNGISNTDHDLTIQVAFDSSNTYSQSRTFHAGSAVTAVGDLEEAKISIGTRRKCNSIRFRVTDTTPLGPLVTLGTGAGPSFQTMGYEVGLKKGDKLPTGKKG